MQETLREEAELFKDIEDILVNFYPDQEFCEIHGTKLLVMKTDTRGVRSKRYPPFTARKIFLYCPMCKLALKEKGESGWRYSPQISLLTRGKSPFSMDMVDQVGRMKFLECERRDDIRTEIFKRFGFSVSAGSITAMGMEFLARLKCLHMLRFDRIVEDIKAGGGYILGIDGTGDGGSDRIFITMDLVRNWVLSAAKIPSESEDNMKPHVESLKEKLGLPLANVCDMAKGMMNVLTNVMLGVALRVCHYHFLNDIGSDLMRDEYMAVRKLIIDTKLQSYMTRLRKEMYHESMKEGIDISELAKELRSGTVPDGVPVEICAKVQTYDAISWMLRYHEDDSGMRFPFVQPYLNFYDRCRRGPEAVMAIRKMAANGWTSPKYLRDLESKIRDDLEGQNDTINELRAEIASLREGIALFEELRETLHIPKEKGDIPRDKLIVRNSEMIAKMRIELEAFRDRLRDNQNDGKNDKEKIVLDHLERYWPYIILDNITVNLKGKDVLIEIPRTSSEYESLFGSLKSDLRMRLGKKDIGYELNLYGDYLCYIQNLKSESYVSKMIGSLNDLPEALESIPPEMVRTEMELLKSRGIGYDITNSRSRGERVELDDILRGVEAVNKWIEGSAMDNQIGAIVSDEAQSNGFLTL
jgi:hypothetical protein